MGPYCGSPRMAMTFGVHRMWALCNGGKSSRTGNPALPGWSVRRQRRTHQNDYLGILLGITRSQKMGGCLAQVGGGSCGCRVVGGWMSFQGGGVDTTLRYCIVLYQRLSFWACSRSDPRSPFHFPVSVSRSFVLVLVSSTYHPNFER